MAFPGVTTARLVLRDLRATDAAALLAYRNDEDTARFQAWQLPFLPAAADELIAGASEQMWPVRGDWYQIGIEHAGDLVGDIGVGRSSDGLQAAIGYTLAPAARGTGLATEAVGAVLDLLFSEGVHRISAGLDPANAASARLVRRLGFRYEGRSVSAEFVRGQWYDEERYALLEVERAAWLAP